MKKWDEHGVPDGIHPTVAREFEPNRPSVAVVNQSRYIGNPKVVGGCWVDLKPAIRKARSTWADWIEDRLSEINGWNDMSDREQAFVVAYACTGDKQESLKFIHRHPAWCYDRRFRSEAFLNLVSDHDGPQSNFILTTRVRLLEEATAYWTLRSVLTMGAVVDAPVSRKTGVTMATQLRAAQSILKAGGFLR